MTGKLAVRAVTGGHGRGPRGRLTTLYSGVRGCPIPGCGEEIDPSRLMCRRHWYTVPKEVRDRVWATWRSGDGAFGREHQDAVRAAIAAVGAAIGRAAGQAPAGQAAAGQAAAGQAAAGQAAAGGPAKAPPSGGPPPGKAGRVPVT